MNCGEIFKILVEPNLEHISIVDRCAGMTIATFESKFASNNGPLSEVNGYPSVRTLLWKCKELQQYKGEWNMCNWIVCVGCDVVNCCCISF